MRPSHAPQRTLSASYRPTRRVTPIDSNLSCNGGNRIADAAVTATRGTLVAYEWVSSDREFLALELRSDGTIAWITPLPGGQPAPSLSSYRLRHMRQLNGEPAAPLGVPE
jgi:hypothetical protein